MADTAAACRDLPGFCVNAKIEAEDRQIVYTPYSCRGQELKSDRNKARRTLLEFKVVKTTLIGPRRPNLTAMSSAGTPGERIGMHKERIETFVVGYFTGIERFTVAWHKNLVDKSITTLSDLEAQRDGAAARLERYLKELGYG